MNPNNAILFSSFFSLRVRLCWEPLQYFHSISMHTEQTTTECISAKEIYFQVENYIPLIFFQNCLFQWFLMNLVLSGLCFIFCPVKIASTSFIEVRSEDQTIMD